LAQVQQQIKTVTFDKNVPITGADLDSLAQRVFTQSWLQQNVEGSLDRIFVWLNGPSGSMLSVPVDLTQPKASLSQGVDDLLTAKIPTLPVCPRTNTDNKICRTSTTTLATVKDMLKKNGIDLTSIEAQLPNTIDLANPVFPTIAVNSKTQTDNAQQSIHEKVQPILDKLDTAKEKYHQARQGYLAGLAVYALLMLGYIALNAAGWKRLAKWVGIAFLAISVLPLAISIASQQVVQKAIVPNLHFDESAPAGLATAASGVIRDLQHTIFSPILMISALLFIFGLAGIIGARFIPIAAAAQGKKS